MLSGYRDTNEDISMHISACSQAIEAQMKMTYLHITAHTQMLAGYRDTNESDIFTRTIIRSEVVYIEVARDFGPPGMHACMYVCTYVCTY
jgi:hypothetical protein